jgi:hypothetical protein
LRDSLNFFKENLPNHPFIRISMNNLASVLQKLNRLKESEELFRDTLEIRKLNLLPNDPDIGASMINLASVLRSLNRLE